MTHSSHNRAKIDEHFARVNEGDLLLIVNLYKISGEKLAAM